MKQHTDKAGLASIKIRNLLKDNLSDKELRIKIKDIILDYGHDKESVNKNYIKRLEDEVKNFRTIKKLLK